MTNTPSSGKKDSAPAQKSASPSKAEQKPSEDSEESSAARSSRTASGAATPTADATTTTPEAPRAQETKKKPASTSSAPSDAAEQPGAAATESQVVFVSAPPEPKKKGARGVGILVALLSTGIFAAVYAALVLLVSIIAPPVAANAALQYFAAPIFWIPVVVFALSYILLVVIVNRAGWWAHVLGGFVIAVLVYTSFVGAALIMASAIGGSAAVVGPIVLSQLTNPLGFAAAVAAREVLSLIHI